MTTRPRRRRRRRIVLLMLLGGYLLLMGFGGCADKLLLYPSTDPMVLAGNTRRTVAAPGGGSVEVWTARSVPGSSREPEAFVLDFIANASRAEPEAAMVADEWSGHDVEVWALNYPGYGGSPGRAALRAIPPAALATFDALAARAGGRPIYVCGHSLGTTAALYVASQRPVAGVILHNPPPLRQLIVQRHGWWNLWLLAGPVALQIPGELDSVANARRVSAPAIFMLAGQDNVVPPRYQQMVVDAYAGPKRLIRLPGAGHNDAPADSEEAALRAAIDAMTHRRALN